MPATRSRASTEQAAEVVAEEVKQVQEASEIVDTPVQETAVKQVEDVAVEPEVVQAAAGEESAAATAEATTNGSSSEAAVVEENGSSEAVADSNGSVTAESNGAVNDIPAETPAVEPETPVTEKRKSEVGGDGDSVPDSTEVKKQKLAESESEEPVVEASA